MTLCTSCAAGCCRRYNVGLTGYDIIKISKALGVSPRFFIDVCELTEEDYLENISRTEALFVFTDNNCKHYYRIKMKKIESAIFKDVQKCIFLQEWKSGEEEQPIIARCGIYGIRPLICASYPAKFVNQNRTAVIPYVFDLDKSMIGTPHELCKGPFKLEDICSNKDEIINLLIKLNYEIDYFKTFAERWNKNPSSISDFIEELDQIYDQRVYVETEADMLKIIA
jgi:Fe-S-cluster containining protein